MTPKQNHLTIIAGALATIAAVVFIVIACAPQEVGECPPCPTCPDIGPVDFGTTNFDAISVDDVTASDDVSVGDDLTVSGDLSVGNGTPNTTLNGEDAYIEGTFEVDGALNLDGAVDMDSTLDVAGNVSDGGGTFTIADDVLIDGAADANQLTVQGYTTQTNSLLVLEQSDGTDKVTVANTGNTDIAGTLQYGANNLYPVGYASSGQQLVYGTDSITGTATAAHGLTTVTFALCTLGEDPTSGAGEAAYCTVSVSGNAVTLKAWQDDFVTEATETDVAIQWIVVGAP